MKLAYVSENKSDAASTPAWITAACSSPLGILIVRNDGSLMGIPWDIDKGSDSGKISEEANATDSTTSGNTNANRA